MDEVLLTPEEVAERLRVKTLTVYEWLRAGRLRGTRLGQRLWRVRSGDLEAFLDAGSNDGAWKERLDAVVTRIRSGLPAGLTEEEIDREVLAACQEARELVSANRR